MANFSEKCTFDLFCQRYTTIKIQILITVFDSNNKVRSSSDFQFYKITVFWWKTKDNALVLKTFFAILCRGNQVQSCSVTLLECGTSHIVLSKCRAKDIVSMHNMN